MITKSDFNQHINNLDSLVRQLRLSMRKDEQQAAPKGKFLGLLEDIEEETRVLRAMLIQHTRKMGKGLRKDGKPDRRYRKNRVGGLDFRVNW